MSNELNTNQRNALAALLSHGTVEAAAAACGLTKRTLFRYLNDAAFVAELHRRQDAILGGVVARLTTLAGESVDKLARALDLLDAHTRATIAPFVTIGEDGKWTVDVAAAECAGALPMVRKLDTDRDGNTRLELHDAQRAADRLGRLVLGVLEQRRKQAEIEQLTVRVSALEEQEKSNG